MQGGLFFPDANPCTGQDVTGAALDPGGTALAIRFRSIPDGDPIDPVGPSLRIERAGAAPALHWQDVGAGGYSILRCLASGPCTPVPHALSGTSTYVDEDAGEMGGSYWYLVTALNGCTAGL